MLDQNFFSVAGTGISMRQAVDDADEQINDFIHMDTEALHIVSMSTQSLYVDAIGSYVHTITMFYQRNKLED